MYQTIQVGKVKNFADIESKRYTPTYIRAFSEDVESPRIEWTKIEWFVDHINDDDKALMFVVFWSKDTMDARVSYWLNLESGRIENYCFFPLNNGFNQTNVFNSNFSKYINHKKKDGFAYIQNLHKYFYYINSIELQNAYMRLRAYEAGMQSEMDSLGAEILDTPLAAEQNEITAARKTSPSVPKPNNFFDPNHEVSLPVESDGSVCRRAYEPKVQEWQVRAYKRRVTLKSGEVRIIEVKPSIRRHKKKVTPK